MNQPGETFSWAIGWSDTALPVCLAIAAAGLSFALIWGACRWLGRLRERLDDPSELKPREDAVVTGACFAVTTIGGLFCAAEAAMVFANTRGTGVFVLLLVSLATLLAGALLGFIFAVPKTAANGEPMAVREDQTLPRSVAPSAVGVQSSTALEQIADWLTKIIVGVGLVEAQQIYGKFKVATAFLANAFGEPTGTARALAAAILVFFSILGFIGTYLITRLYIAAALGRAERDMRRAFATTEEKKRTREDIAPALFPLLQRREIRVEDLPRQTREVVDKMNAKDFSSLVKPEDFATWGFAKLAAGNYSDARRALKEAVRQRADSAQYAYAYAVALARSGGSDDEVYNTLREAKEKITSETNPETREGIYTSLMYKTLYRPRGYSEAIGLAEEYRTKFGDLSDEMLVDLACAYGQKVADLRAANTEGAEGEIQKAREEAFKAVGGALAKDQIWRDRFQQLMYKDYPGKADSPILSRDNDLEVFADDAQFRELVGKPNVESRNS